MEWNNLSLCTIMFQWMTLNDKKLEYAKFGKVCLNNHTSLSHSNILQRPNQWACFCTKKHLGATLPKHFISHVQEWPILLESDMSDSIVVCRYGR
jgi:hypothetical protein